MTRVGMASLLLLAGCASNLPEPRCHLDRDCSGAAVCEGMRCVDPAVLGTKALLQAHRLVLRPADDAVVSLSSAERVLGPTDFLMAGGAGASQSWRTYLRFDLSAVRGRVLRAELRLRTRSDPPGVPHGLCIVGVYLSRGPWRGSRLTWDNQPGAAGPERAFAILRGGTDAEVRIDVSELVSDLVRGAAGNNGFVLQARRESGPARMVAYSSHSPMREVRPWLEIFYQ